MLLPTFAFGLALPTILLDTCCNKPEAEAEEINKTL